VKEAPVVTKKMFGLACAVVMVLGGVSTATAQDAMQGGPPRPSAQSPPPQGGGEGLPANPAEVGRLFDAYALVQAQEQLGLDEDAFARFMPKFKVLIDARRRQLQERLRMMNALARLTRAATPDEAALREHLRRLDEHDVSSSADVRKASEAVTSLLTPLQAARFRLFEEQMERRKLDLLMRARQNRRNLRLP
jgi:Spy/CpxP family protein refolding chaperone